MHSQLDAPDDRQREAARELNRRDSEAESAYRNKLDDLGAARRVLVQRCEDACLKFGLKSARVIARVKSWESLLPKIQDGRVDSWDRCKDLLAVRIVVLSAAEIQTARSAVSEFRHGDDVQKHTWYESKPRSHGHHAVHLQIDLTPFSQLPEALREVGAELQIVTALQEAWGSFSHDDFYKAKDGVPEKIRQRVKRLSAVLTLADDELQSLRDSVQQSVKDRISVVGDAFVEGTTDTIDLDQVVFTACVALHLNSKFVALRDVAREAGCRVSGWATLAQPSEIDRFLAFAAQANILTVRDLAVALDRALQSGAQLSRVVTRHREQHLSGAANDFRLFDRPIDALIISESLLLGYRVSPPLHVEIMKAVIQVHDDPMDETALVS